MQEAQEARRLLLEAKAKGVSNTQIQRITGLAIRTINKWIVAMPGKPKPSAVEKFLLLGLGYRVTRGRTGTDGTAESVDRLYTALDAAYAEGLGEHDIARISGIGVDHVRRLRNTPRENKKHIQRHTLEGAIRIERYIESRRKRERRRAVH